MILLIRPLLLKFAQSEQVKRLVVDLLRKAADSTETTVDNEMVDFVERGLFGELAGEIAVDFFL